MAVSVSPYTRTWLAVFFPLLIAFEVAGAAYYIAAAVGKTPSATRSLPDSLTASAPPPTAFKVVWPVLYALAAAGLTMLSVGQAQPGSVSGYRWAGVAFLGASIALSFGWTPVFQSGDTRGATWMIVAMLVLAVAGVVCAASVNTTSAVLWTPYLVWLAFALILSSEINQKRQG